MFERLQKPFLTIETGEAYQPMRLAYVVHDQEKLLNCLNHLNCLEKTKDDHHWQWLWQAEAQELPFSSIASFQRPTAKALRVGSLVLAQEALYLHLPSFKRGCLAVPFFHRIIDPAIAQVHHADFLNKVYSTEEHLLHGFAELFKEEELQAILSQRIQEYQQIQQGCEQANSLDEALTLLANYTEKEANKKLPFMERYEFDFSVAAEDPETLFVSFYIFLRSRELVAIRCWFGEGGYTLSAAVDEILEDVFGTVGIDIIE